MPRADRAVESLAAIAEPMVTITLLHALSKPATREVRSRSRKRVTEKGALPARYARVLRMRPGITSKRSLIMLLNKEAAVKEVVTTKVVATEGAQAEAETGVKGARVRTARVKQRLRSPSRNPRSRVINL